MTGITIVARETGYVAEEVPEPLEYTWLDADGQPIDFSTTQWDASIRWQAGTSDPVERAATLSNPAAGVWTYVWQPGDLDTAGTYRGEFVVENDAQRYVRRFAMRVRPAVPAHT